MVDTEDYYEILGVSKTATAKEIGDAYRKIAMKNHPDRSTDDAEEEKERKATIFKKAAEAFEVLNDPLKRKNYDTYGKQGPTSSRRHTPGGFNFDELFNQMYADPDEDGQRVLNVSLTLKDVYLGKKITIPIEKECPNCKGQGGLSFESCKKCRGQGFVMTAVANFAVQSRCGSCGGKGKIIKEKCRTCNGKKQVSSDDVQKLDIPKGLRNGFVVKISGGHYDYVSIKVEAHPLYQVSNDDLVVYVPVTYSELLYGTVVDLIHPTGETISLKVPPNSNRGKLCLKGLGLPSVDSAHVGNIYAVIILDTPEKYTVEYLEAYDKIKHLEKDISFKNKEKFNKILKEVGKLNEE